MNLSPAVPRRHMHTRRIHSKGFRRKDGLWDIESHIIDNKTYPYTEPCRGHRHPEDDVHHMSIRLTVDNDMVVRAIEVSMSSVPYPTCGAALPNYKALVGKTVARGWRKTVMEVAAGNCACTHVRELLVAAGSMVFQTIQGWPEEGPNGHPLKDVNPQILDLLMDSCAGLKRGGDGAAHLTKFYTGTKGGQTASADREHVYDASPTLT